MLIPAGMPDPAKVRTSKEVKSEMENYVLRLAALFFSGTRYVGPRCEINDVPGRRNVSFSYSFGHGRRVSNFSALKFIESMKMKLCT